MALQNASEVSTLECSICLELLCEPIKLPCSHVFCRRCLAGFVRVNRHCALCRASIPETFDPLVAPMHRPLEQVLMRQCTVEYMQRMEDVALEAAHLVRLRIGNKYEFLGFHCRHRHSWTLKVELEAQPEACLPQGAMLPDIIKHVRFALAPACRVLSCGSYALSEAEKLEQTSRPVEVMAAPFEVSATSPVSCTVPIVITWQDWVGQPPLQLEHALDFCRDGGCWDYALDLHSALASDGCDLNVPHRHEREVPPHGETLRTQSLAEAAPAGEQNSQQEVAAKHAPRWRSARIFSAGLARIGRHLPKMQRTT